MKKLFNNILLIGAMVVGLASVSLTTNAADGSTSITGATITSLLQGPYHLQSLEVINNHPTDAVIVYFYDAPTNVLTWTSTAYTNWNTYTTNIVITTTNYNGVVETATNLATFTIPRINAAGTQNFRRIRTMSVAAAGTTTWTPVNGVYVSYGLAATNNATNTTINYTYSSVR